MKDLSDNTNTAGFSLLEMMVVLVVIGLSTALMTVQFDLKARKLSPNEFSRIVKANLVRERLHAISQGVVNNIVFDLRRNQKSISGHLTNEKIPDHISVDLLTGRELVKVSNVASIQYLPDGSSLGAEILIKSNNQISSVIKVNWLTGLASIKKLDR